MIPICKYCWFKVVLGGALEMYPAAITQKEKQLARSISSVDH